MLWIAWRILVGDTAKYLGMIIGVAFASLLIAQQASIFCGLMRLTVSQILDVEGAAIWVMDPDVQFVDDIKPLSENELLRVRGVEGVRWAVRFFKGLGRARLAEGEYQQVVLLGLDDATLVGAPQTILLGSLDDLRQPDAVMMDRRGFERLWPGEPLSVGKTFEMNDRRAVIVGVCESRRTFQTFPVVYTRYSQATMFAPHERKLLSFILVQNEPNVDADALCRRITQQTGLQALTRNGFIWKTIFYYLRQTGIPVNFGITVLLGFIVGVAIAGQTFYLFAVENARQYATLKALGLSDARVVVMILQQAVVVGLIGYSIGVGGAAIFGLLIQNRSKLAFFMPWQVLLGTGIAVLVIVLAVSVLSVRRVIVMEPAEVFK
ncbi:MAG: FtsX-like permease family protein [Pirellulales bacterium]|nr:FtsX-like permease family protein [Planctomycetales bacterium]